MSSSPWKVIGASGFVGSAILARLRAEGTEADPIEAPRLSTHATDAKTLIKEARRLEAIIDSLADSFAGAEVVINASGLAAPSQQDLAPLVGANALLPAVIAIAAQRTGIKRLIHMSSAAVQGNVEVLDSTPVTQPFSAYSFSKALGEEVLLNLERFINKQAAAGAAPGSAHSDFPAAPASAPATVAPHHALELCIVRATSVMGRGRRTTEAFARFASSPLASVAAGNHRTPIASNYALAEFTVKVGAFDGHLPSIVLQPWEGATAKSVLVDAGRRLPLQIPVSIARAAVAAGYAISEALGDRFQAPVRRIELMWFGQDQDDSWAQEHQLIPTPRVSEVLRDAHTALGKKQDARFTS
ncbi:NAD(P)-dependent oxidoreductase [Rothia sp. ZJ1223]|uniref:NAD-dependent epimerase/dehydratase family protein n=1 Tax=Rothia sp. ZJ1223 TaxID=2811098 RepID=UPI0019572850|nr:NAD-dependent epimerase/dehydratase family protein [Rothia sp. ZJ1223]MBM7051001.1 NAD-dependent epimerase/dehydratase family protein [Rothia sp. ZJ1223]